ncbi:hypothetical protein F4692_001099 [Nocardioides cavernae]|uniref:DUF4064 domain-containing protein n=1 Tax=Nocardioides cavernae TaxID=1921566 RepID=A0A7Y9KQV7_9ACTN|nr:DUF2304 domain-containing protein [Nocardioides cavernae]NYE35995.1 hypothetical protein [Nocardioides cavernae]
MSEPSDPGPTHSPYGQDPYGPPPTGQSPYGQQPGYGQQQPAPYGQQPYGQGYPQAYDQKPGTGRRPGTVTAAAWITIAFSGLVAALFGLALVAMVVARDDFVREIERSPEFRDLNVDPESALGATFAFLGFFILWSLIAVVLAVFVLRRSNVARILLVISSSVVALLSLLGIASGISLVPLLAAVAVIVLLFVGGAGDWFRGGGQAPAAYGQAYPSTGQHGHGGQDNPYGQQPPTYDSTDGGSGTDYPPQDYPGR